MRIANDIRTPEEKKAARLAAYKKYHASEKGIATRRLYENTSPKVAAKQERYRKSEKGIAMYRAHDRGPKRKASRKKRGRFMERYGTDFEFRMLHNLRVRIRQVIRLQGAKKLGTSMSLIGCSPAHLRAWLEFWMKPGMTWENYGDWHIDHKKPCASFDLVNIEEQRKCFHYTNLEPLWAEDNLKKGSSWPG